MDESVKTTSAFELNAPECSKELPYHLIRSVFIDLQSPYSVNFPQS